MEAFSCIDETFDVNLASEYRLSIQAGLDGFSFSVLDELRKKFIVFKNIPFRLSNHSFLVRKLDEIFKDEEILQNSYKQVSIGLNSNLFTFAPDNMLLPDESLILGLNHNLASENNIFSYSAGLAGLKIIYAFPESMVVFFRSHFENPFLYHFSEPLISEYADKVVPGKPSSFIFTNQGDFAMLVHDRERIVFANTFSFRAEDDFNFFVASSLQSLAIKPEEITLYLAGDINRASTRFSYLKGRFGLVEFLKLPKVYQYSYTFGVLPQHSFISVINFTG